MAYGKINPKSPGAGAGRHADPHDRVETGAGGHAGLGRDESGSFKGMAQGGSSEHGDEYVSKYKPGGSGGGKTVRSGSELNDDGDDWA